MLLFGTAGMLITGGDEPDCGEEVHSELSANSRGGAHDPLPPGIVHEAQTLADSSGLDTGTQTHTLWTR